MEETKSKLKHLVIDAGAIIKGAALHELADNFWTIEEVLEEIRDQRARSFLAGLTFEIKVREPSDAAMKQVIDFARKTGDFAFLSMTDLKVMALTLQFELEVNGDKNIRSEPQTKRVHLSSQGERSVQEASDAKNYMSTIPCKYHFQSPMGCRFGEECRYSHDAERFAQLQRESSSLNEEETLPSDEMESNEQLDASVEEGETTEEEREDETDKENETTPRNKTETTQASEEDMTEILIEKMSTGLVVVDAKDVKDVKEMTERTETQLNQPFSSMSSNSNSRILSASSYQGVVHDMVEVDDGKNWIDVSNCKDFMLSPFGNGMNVESDLSDVQVGCITTDFSMQNVILQLGLKLLSADGMLIRRVKQWILRCAACYYLTSEMERLFCSKCGNNTMERITCSVDAHGNIKLFERSNASQRRNYALRGSRFSIPKTRGGREGDLLLREDQLMYGVWNQRFKQKARKQTSAFGADVTYKLGMNVLKNQRHEDIVVGMGRMNPNAQRGRERRGKKKKSSK